MSKKSKKRKKSKMNSYLFYLNDGTTIKKMAINELSAEQMLKGEDAAKGIRGTSIDNIDEYVLKNGVWEPNDKFYPMVKSASNIYGNFCFPEDLCFGTGTILPKVDKERAKELLPKLEGTDLDISGDATLSMSFSDKAILAIEEWEFLHNCNKVDYVFVPLKIYVAMSYSKLIHKASPFRIPYVMGPSNKVSNHMRYKW